MKHASYLLESQSCKGHINFDAVKVHLDDGHKGLRDGTKIADLGLTFQHLIKAGKVVLAMDMTGRDAKCVNICTLIVDT